jgi:hypothetical protein
VWAWRRLVVSPSGAISTCSDIDARNPLQNGQR